MPDPRLQKLADIVHPERVLAATVEFVDIAGLVKGASKGEGLGNKFLGNIREVDAIVHVVRCFEDDNIIHVDGKVNPVSDKEVIDIELQLKDLETIEKRLQKTEKSAKSGDAIAKKESEIMKRIVSCLESGKNVRELTFDDSEIVFVKSLQLLTQKSIIYVANVEETAVVSGNQHVEKLREAVKHEGAQVVVVCAALEAQIAQLDDPEEKEMFLSEYGLKESGLDKLIKASYDLLDLITYFTAGKQEVRAWTIKKGWKAPKAAGVIHTDFERGFIRAEVIKYENYKALKSELACKEAGKLAVEGKEYVVTDGDIMHFRFNV